MTWQLLLQPSTHSCFTRNAKVWKTAGERVVFNERKLKKVQSATNELQFFQITGRILTADNCRQLRNRLYPNRRPLLIQWLPIIGRRLSAYSGKRVNRLGQMDAQLFVFDRSPLKRAACSFVKKLILSTVSAEGGRGSNRTLACVCKSQPRFQFHPLPPYLADNLRYRCAFETRRGPAAGPSNNCWRQSKDEHTVGDTVPLTQWTTPCPQSKALGFKRRITIFLGLRHPHEPRRICRGFRLQVRRRSARAMHRSRWRTAREGKGGECRRCSGWLIVVTIDDDGDGDGEMTLIDENEGKTSIEEHTSDR